MPTPLEIRNHSLPSLEAKRPDAFIRSSIWRSTNHLWTIVALVRPESRQYVATTTNLERVMMSLETVHPIRRLLGYHSKRPAKKWEGHPRTSASARSKANDFVPYAQLSVVDVIEACQPSKLDDGERNPGDAFFFRWTFFRCTRKRSSRAFAYGGAFGMLGRGATCAASFSTDSLRSSRHPEA